jgi:hypothetical protein
LFIYPIPLYPPSPIGEGGVIEKRGGFAPSLNLSPKYLKREELSIYFPLRDA